jgi:hypothetical protein
MGTARCIQQELRNLLGYVFAEARLSYGLIKKGNF